MAAATATKTGAKGTRLRPTTTIHGAPWDSTRRNHRHPSLTSSRRRTGDPTTMKADGAAAAAVVAVAAVVAADEAAVAEAVDEAVEL